jgi:hypothetical protein
MCALLRLESEKQLEACDMSSNVTQAMINIA